jgi:hypothetical protein
MTDELADTSKDNVTKTLSFSGMCSIVAKRDDEVVGFVFRCGEYSKKLLSYSGSEKVGEQKYYVPMDKKEFQKNGSEHYFMGVLEDAVELYAWMCPREFSNINYDEELLVLRIDDIGIIAKDTEKDRYRLTRSGYFLTTNFEFFSVPKEEWLARLSRDM